MKRWVAFASACIIVGMAVTIWSDVPATSIGLPGGIPGVPSLSPQDVATKAAAKELAPWLAGHVPIILDWTALYPTVDNLAGKSFAATPGTSQQDQLRSSIQGQLAHSTTGIVKLAPGDYAVQMRVYCTSHQRHAGHEALWLLGPLRGTRANVLEAIYARASGKNLNFSAVQSLSWAMQAGMRYDELPAASKQLVDQLIPDLRPQISGSFLDQVQDEWSSLSSTIPNLPSLDSALGKMGSTGQTILNIKYARDTIIADANDFDAMSRALVPSGGSGADSGAGPPPWSKVSDAIYERILTQGTFGTMATFEIRVIGTSPATVPFTSVISYASKHQDWQPLTQESPTLSFGGP